MTQTIPPTRRALTEALELSAEILKNVELSELPLANVALKASRLARLINDHDMQRIMEYEAGGYPTQADGVPPEVWRLAVAAGRRLEQKDSEGNPKEYVYLESIAELEHESRMVDTALQAARDPDVHLSSANPYQTVVPPFGNRLERDNAKYKSSTALKRLSNCRTLIYRYALRKHYELKFSGIADDIFSRIRQRVDEAIGSTVPDAVQKLSAVHDGLLSDNPEDWANAVHSCRRILKDLADAVFPPRSEDRVVKQETSERTIHLGPDNYVNRIMCYVEDNSASTRFTEIVGSHLAYLGDRLDSVSKAAQKGSHKGIVRREEADRYVVYTYLIVGDVLSLVDSASGKAG